MKRFLLLLPAILLFAGCSVNPFTTAVKNVENSKNLRVGMTKNEVLTIMGEPVKDEVFCKPDLWYYYFETVWGDGFITEEECFPLVFEKGRLVGWGHSFLVRYRTAKRNDLPTEDPQAR